MSKRKLVFIIFFYKQGVHCVILTLHISQLTCHIIMCLRSHAKVNVRLRLVGGGGAALLISLVRLGQGYILCF